MNRIFQQLFIIITSLLSLMFLSGCTLEFDKKPDDQILVLPFSIEMQSMRSTPNDGSQIIDITELQMGDILLSRAIGLTSLGVRAFTTSSVSHAAIYIGDNQVAEAVGKGVQFITLDDSIAESRMVAVYRYPELNEENKTKIREFANIHLGKKYNYLGIALMVPFSLTRQICEIPPLGHTIRNECLQLLASIQVGQHKSQQRFFCSQFVLEAYNYAGQPITDSNPVWINPDDLMHMREGDVKSMMPNKELIYVGHLKTSGKANKA